MERSELLLSIRPSIPQLVDANATKSAEKFQNSTLRPILKFQNDLLILLFRQYAFKRKNIFYNLSLNDKLNYIKSSIQKDQRFKNLLIGCIIGHFNAQEWKAFAAEENELTRRITTLIIQRLQHQVDKI